MFVNLISSLTSIIESWLFNQSNAEIVESFSFFLTSYKPTGVLTSILLFGLYLILARNQLMKTSLIVLSSFCINLFVFFVVFPEVSLILKEKSYEISDYQGDINNNSKDFVKMTEKHKYSLHIEYRYYTYKFLLRNSNAFLATNVTINPQLLIFKKDSNVILKTFNYEDGRTLNELINDFEKSVIEEDAETL